MGNRYYLTGTQLGMLMRLQDEKERMKILNKIMNNQCLGNKARRALARLRERN